MWLVAIADILAAHQIAGVERAHRLKNLGFLVVHEAIVAAGGRLHGEQRDDLEQVVLDYVAQAAGALVKGTAAVDAEILRQRHLDARDIVAVPDRFEERIGETEVEDVHDRLLAEEVIDAEDRIFGEDAARDAVERARGAKIAPERLFDDDARIAGETGAAEPFDHRLEQSGRDRQIVRGARRAAQRLIYRLVGGLIVVVPADVAEEGQQAVQRGRIVDAARSFHAILHAVAQLRQAPVPPGDANDRDVQGATFGELVKRGEDLLVRKIAGRAEQHQCVRTGRGHRDLAAGVSATLRKIAFSFGARLANRERDPRHLSNAKQRGGAAAPAPDRSRAVGEDDRVPGLIDDPLGQVTSELAGS